MPRRRDAGVPFGVLVIAAAIATTGCDAAPARSDEGATEAIMTDHALPAPATRGAISLEEAIARRRSHRAFAGTVLSTREIGQLCWATHGVTGDGGHRAAPSAGALYPLELHVATAEGLFHYSPGRHALRRTGARDVRAALRDAAYGQDPVGEAPLVLVLSGVIARTAARYGDRATRFVELEAGHAAQNALLQATALGLAGVPIGAFDEDAVRRAIGADEDTTPLYLIPIGRPR